MFAIISSSGRSRCEGGGREGRGRGSAWLSPPSTAGLICILLALAPNCGICRLTKMNGQESKKIFILSV